MRTTLMPSLTRIIADKKIPTGSDEVSLVNGESLSNINYFLFYRDQLEPFFNYINTYYYLHGM